MIHMLRLSVPNVFLITGDKAILVDSGTPKDVPRVLAFLRAHDVEPGKLSLILLTHGHWDHAGGAAELRTVMRAPVAIHHADADRVRRGINGPLKPTCLTGRLLRPWLDHHYPPVEPDVVIEREMDLTKFGVAARILFTPGHTPGSLSVRTDDGAFSVGDLLTGGVFGGWLWPARPGLHYFADDIAQVHASVQKVLAAEPTSIYAGHGGPFDPQVVAQRFAPASYINV